MFYLHLILCITIVTIRTAQTYQLKPVSDDRQKHIHVDIEEPKEPKVKEDTSVRFVCEARREKQNKYSLSCTKIDEHIHDKGDNNGTIFIPNVGPEDVFLYECTGSDIFQKTKDVAKQNGTGDQGKIQVFIDQPKEQKVDEGASVRFVCVARGSSQTNYSLTWTKIDGQMPHKAIDHNGDLFIPNVTAEDAGRYECIGSDIFHKATDTAMLIVTGTPEQIRVEIRPPKTQIVDEKASVRFVCVARGSTDNKYMLAWTKINGQIPNRAIDQNGTLLIHNVRQEDAGRYECTGSDIFHTATDVVTLIVNDPRLPTDIVVIVRQVAIIATVGSTAQLVCYAQDQSIRPTLIWSKSGGLPPGSAQDNGILTLNNIQRSYGGTYVCTAVTPEGDKGTGTVTVTVTEKSVVSTAKVTPDKTTIAQGTTGTLRCEVTGTPQPTIVWSKSREELTSRHQVVGDTLRITNAQIEDRGIYICRADNSAGQGQGWSMVEVERRAKPKLDIYPSKSQTIKVGESALFQCRVMGGDPPPIVSWARAGGEAMTSSIEVKENGVLMFQGATGAEAGEYICTATNDMGSVSATATLVIQGPPRIIISPSKKVIAVIGQQVSLECIGEGNPIPTVQWRYERPQSRGDIPTPVESAPSQGSARLVLESVTTSDSGNYYCTAKNDGGSITETVELTVGGVSPDRETGVYIEGPKELRVRKGQTVTLDCDTEGIPNAVVRWRRRNGLMPPNHSARGGTLTIPNFKSQYSGEYICLATSGQSNYESSVFIIVTVLPSLTISPARVEARAGGTIQLRCTPQGSGPFNIEWTKYNGALNPTSVQTGDGLLEIRQVTAADFGRYRCLATSNGITSDGYAIVTVQVPPTIILGAREYRPYTGQLTELRCQATGSPTPRITWEKENGVLPRDHTVNNGVLQILNVEAEDSGRYICTATSSAGTARDYVRLNVLGVGPDNGGTIKIHTNTVNIGERVEMECGVTGDPTPVVTWTRIDGPMPETSTVNDVVLVIPQVRMQDAGTYQCTAQNIRGTVQQRVNLFVKDLVPYFPQDPVSYITYPPMNDIYLVFDILLRLKPEATDGLILYNGNEDTGRGDYVCFGLREGYPEFSYDVGSGPAIIQANETLALNQWHTVRLERNRKTGKMTVDDRNQFDGEAPGRFQVLDLSKDMYLGGVPDYSKIPQPARYTSGFVGAISQVQRNGDNLNLGADAKNIEGVELYDACQYRPCQNGARCVPANLGDGFRCVCPQGYTGDRCELQGQMCYEADNGGTIKIDTNTVNIGERVEMECVVTGDPTPVVTWTRIDGPMPETSTVNDVFLVIPQVRMQDAGTYQCTAQNIRGTVQQRVNLFVKDLVPYFPQDPVSYITYPPMNDIYLYFDILLRLKPEATDGLILYNGNEDTGRGDYVCFGLREGYPEFSYDVGSGTAIIQANETLGLNHWHTVRLERNRKTGKMTVDDRNQFDGEAPGRFQVLDLSKDMYLGGVPDYSKIPQPARYTSGFVGAISQVQINGDNLNLGADAKNIEGVELYDACQYRPCQNGARCVPANLGDGFRCVCPQGYTGDRCELQGQMCYEGACGSSGRCRDLENGFICICPMGRSGASCMTVGRITLPRFNTSSFAAYPAVQGAKFQMKIEMEFKPQSLDDGIILYSGQSNDGSGDYVSIAIINGYLEFRYNIEFGPAVLNSRRRLTANDWVKVVATKNGQEGTLIVNNEEPVKAVSPGTTIGLDLRTMLYIGGTDPDNKLPQSLGISNGIVGCVAELLINNQPLELITKAVETYNVNDCGERNICNRRPCLNGGTCERLSSVNYRCVCPPKYQGTNCETEINVCMTKKPCQNNALCSITDEGYRCDCPLGYIGVHCEGTTRLGEKISVVGDGFLEFDKSFLQTQENEVVKFTIRTTHNNGLIFWKGQATLGGLNTQSKDYVSLGLKDGFLEYSYDLGSGPAVLRSLQRVDDGYCHTVEVSRLDRQGKLKIDNKEETSVEGTSQGILQMLNAGSNLFIGGVSSVESRTGNKYTENFNGCIYDIYFLDKGPLRAPEDAIRGYNVRPCLN